MDTTTVASALARAWELLAHLAACGQAQATIRDAEALAQRIADLARDHLPCPWGLFLLPSSVGPTPTPASWGLDDEQAELLIVRNGHGLPAGALEIPILPAEARGGALLLGITPAAEPILTPAFAQALRSQLELLVSLHWREAEQLREQQRSRELFVLYENSRLMRAP